MRERERERETRQRDKNLNARRRVCQQPVLVEIQLGPLEKIKPEAAATGPLQNHPGKLAVITRTQQQT
jgi:hypothetical protein